MEDSLPYHEWRDWHDEVSQGIVSHCITPPAPYDFSCSITHSNFNPTLPLHLEHQVRTPRNRAHPLP